jgi:hypothetical protein
LDVWQIKDLGELGRRREWGGSGRRAEPAMGALVKNNIHHYNIDVNRNTGTARRIREFAGGTVAGLDVFACFRQALVCSRSQQSCGS